MLQLIDCSINCEGKIEPKNWSFDPLIIVKTYIVPNVR